MGPPANLPDFRGLTRIVATGISLEPEELEPEDRFLGRLFFNKIKVHELAASPHFSYPAVFSQASGFEKSI